MSLKLYGYLVSQPTRAVAWLLKAKGADFELVRTIPRTADVRTPEYLAMNPNAKVPTLQDGDLTLFESNAIMQYVAEKFEWTDVYPSDLRARAKVNQYLHWHHRNTRLASVEVVRPLRMQLNGVATPAHLAQLERKDETLEQIMRMLESFFVKPYVAETTQPSIADFACYCELDQIELMDLYDFAKAPRTRDWLARMKEIPFHDDVRQDLQKFKIKLQQAGLL